MGLGAAPFFVSSKSLKGGIVSRPFCFPQGSEIARGPIGDGLEQLPDSFDPHHGVRILEMPRRRAGSPVGARRCDCLAPQQQDRVAAILAFPEVIHGALA
jgi:hypothetical protein